MHVPPMIAEALGLTSLDREAVSRRLAEIGGFRVPTRPESVAYLVATLQTRL